MERIALVTYRENPKLADGEELLGEGLRRRGFGVSEIPWDESGVDWKDFDRVVLRASWDYHTRLSEFSDWLTKLKEAGVNFWNPIEVIKWNIDKHYLKELESGGIPIIPTVFIDRGQQYDLEKCVGQLEAETIVVKPTTGASAYGVRKFDKNDLISIGQSVDQLLRQSDVMVQRFMPQVLTVGEYSLIFFDKKYSHAALKKPAATDFRTQPHFGGSEGVVYPTVDLIKQAQRVVEAVDSPLLYARVDGIDDGGILRLMELELAEPYLFFEQEPQAANRFIEAMERLKKISADRGLGVVGDGFF